MKTTLMQRGAATVLPVSVGADRLCATAPTAALVQGTGVSVAGRVRHAGDAFAFDVAVPGTAVDAAPPPRGAPV